MISRRAKAILAGLTFLFSVGAVSVKLLGGRVTDFCFCTPPVAKPAFTMPDEKMADMQRGGALPGRVIASRAPIQVEVINAPALEYGGSGSAGVHGDLAHLGVLWGTHDHFPRGSSSSGGHFAVGGGAGGGSGVMGGARSSRSTATPAANKPAKPAATTPRAPGHASAPGGGSGGAIIPPAPAVVPPVDTSGGFGTNTDPVPGFGTGATGSTSTPGLTGGFGGPSGGGPVGGSGGALSVTPEPGTMLLTLTGLLAVFGAARKRNKAEAD